MNFHKDVRQEESPTVNTFDVDLVLRRVPTQNRSKAKVHNILTVADKMVAEQGCQAVVQSTAELIKMSGVSTGVFYHYFENGEVVLDALVILYFNKAVALIDDIEHKDFPRWEDAIDTLIDKYAHFYRDSPTFRELRLRGQSKALGDEATKYIHRTIVRIILRAARGSIRFTPAGEKMVSEIGDRLLHYAFEATPGGDPLLIAEVKSAMKCYCSIFVVEGNR